MIIKFLIYEKPLGPKFVEMCSIERVEVKNNIVDKNHEDSSSRKVAQVQQAEPDQIHLQ